jgi:ribosomal protein L31
LIDEYDNFANEIAMGGARSNAERYQKMVTGDGVLKTVFKNVKAAMGEGRLDRVFVTGVSPMLLSDLTSGFNTATDISLERQMHDLCGFTEAEVVALTQQISDQCGFTTAQTEQTVQLMRSFYNGYTFLPEATAALYNPTLSLYFLDALQRDCAPPAEMLDVNLSMDKNKLEYIAGRPGGGAGHGGPGGAAGAVGRGRRRDDAGRGLLRRPPRPPAAAPRALSAAPPPAPRRPLHPGAGEPGAAVERPGDGEGAGAHPASPPRSRFPDALSSVISFTPASTTSLPPYTPAPCCMAARRASRAVMRSTPVRFEICSACHPFYTGKEKLVDTAGRVDRFKKKQELQTKTSAYFQLLQFNGYGIGWKYRGFENANTLIINGIEWNNRKLGIDIGAGMFGIYALTRTERTTTGFEPNENGLATSAVVRYVNMHATDFPKSFAVSGRFQPLTGSFQTNVMWSTGKIKKSWY